MALWAVFYNERCVTGLVQHVKDECNEGSTERDESKYKTEKNEGVLVASPPCTKESVFHLTYIRPETARVLSSSQHSLKSVQVDGPQDPARKKAEHFKIGPLILMTDAIPA